jgi:DNA-binding response OmpR family regulator
MKSSSAMIIDDEKDICFLLGKILTEKKFTITICNTLKDGLRKLNEVKPDVLFLDIRLPDGSGLEALKTIRKQHQPLKIIMMSAYDGVNERRQATESGADLFLGKPLNTELIYGALQKMKSASA